MPKITALTAALSGAALVLTLAACGGSVTPEPATTESGSPAPVGTGDFTPDADWFTALETAKADLTYYVESWDNQSCTMVKVADGDFNCNIHISGILGGVQDAGVLLADVINVTEEAADQVADLQDAAAVAEAAVAAAGSYTEQVCDFAPDESCAGPGDTLVAVGKDLNDALSGWTAP
jgi:hypothetical protein